MRVLYETFETSTVVLKDGTLTMFGVNEILVQIDY